MHADTLKQDTQPWYRQGWPWLLIGLPASAVIGGIITITLAIQSPNALVVDDYYKAGLAINQVKHRQELAQAMQLQGFLRSDGRRFSLRLSGETAVSDPVLTLRLIHATRAELDQTLVMKRNPAGVYETEPDSILPGIWYLRLAPDDRAWEIRNRLVIDGPFQALLTPEV